MVAGLSNSRSAASTRNLILRSCRAHCRRRYNGLRPHKIHALNHSRNRCRCPLYAVSRSRRSRLRLAPSSSRKLTMACRRTWWLPHPEPAALRRRVESLGLSCSRRIRHSPRNSPPKARPGAAECSVSLWSLYLWPGVPTKVVKATA